MAKPVNILRPADIIVSTTAANVSGAIRTATGSSVSHAMVYIGNQFVVEAISVGVVKRTLTQALRDATLAIALRRRNLSKEQANSVIKHAEEFVAKKLPYDNLGAVGSGVATKRGSLLARLASAACGISLVGCLAGASAIANNARKENADKAFFCSELVARIFELAGAPITGGSPSFTTPRHVRVASNLLYIAHLKDT
jgi:uncharacterized protein YycO